MIRKASELVDQTVDLMNYHSEGDMPVMLNITGRWTTISSIKLDEDNNVLLISSTD